MSEPKATATCKPQDISRTQLVDLTCSILRQVLSEQGDPLLLASVGEQTCLIGSRSALTSLGLVSLVVELEQRLEEEHAITVTIADERAMSHKNSPFRTVGSLADYICQLIAQD